MTVGVQERQDSFEATWANPRGFKQHLMAVSHKPVAVRYLVTGFAFFLIGGIQALLMRVQLGTPENTFLDPQAYNQLFTMHGTTMMFLFIVPFLEGAAAYLLPPMLGTRDLPFPRLNAFNYWTYLFAGIFLYSSFLFGTVPDGGWFSYVPLTGPEFSPGAHIDFWLLGISLAEVTAIGAGIEIIVVILKQRAPGMTMNRMPLFAWTMLVAGIMIVFAFTVLLAGSILLEMDRKFGTRFYDPTAGGDPILWQHFFWIFGHPEVYIMFLPATGIVSQVVQTFTGRSLVAYPLVVLSIIATGFLSFGLWIHHMFTVGLPAVSMSFFTAASMMIAIPNGIQVFAWIATMIKGRPRLEVPMLWVIAFIVTFVAGGITGVMVAAVPFDLQVHDSFFVVAHFHYVLIGGVVFPIFAGLYYWLPKTTGRMLSTSLGSWNFWLTFIGFNLTFFPMHITGLLGMPRRVYTFTADRGWDELNLISTIGAFVLAVGFLLFLVNFFWSIRSGAAAPADPWGGDTLEWRTSSPPSGENFRDLPVVTGRHPMWDEAAPEAVPGVAALAERPVGWRAALATSSVDAEPQGLVHLALNTIWPLVTAAGLAVMFISILIDSLFVTIVGALVAAGGLYGWMAGDERERGYLEDDPPPEELGEPAVGMASTGWWGTLWFVAVAGTMLGAFAFAFLYLRLDESAWPPEGVSTSPLGLATVALVGLVGCAALVWTIRSRSRRDAAAVSGPLVLLAAALGTIASIVWGYDLATQDFGHREHAYGSAFHVLGWSTLVVVAIGIVMLLNGRLRAATGPGYSRGVFHVHNSTLYWSFISLAALGTYVTLYLVPRVT